MEMNSADMEFHSGLTAEQAEALEDAIVAVSSLARQIEDLGRHRSYSLAVTKLEEAKHWLRDRRNKPA